MASGWKRHLGLAAAIGVGVVASFASVGFAAGGTETTGGMTSTSSSTPTSTDGTSTTGTKGPRVAICHKGRTLWVAKSAVPAHTAHGDQVGTCAQVAERKAKKAKKKAATAGSEDAQDEQGSAKKGKGKGKSK